MKEIFRLGTRNSILAKIQAQLAKEAFEKQYPDKTVMIIPIVTTGDRYQKSRLSDIGGKGLFIKEIEEALKRNEIDFAVHSMKDVETKIHSDYVFPAILERANPYDVLVSKNGQNLNELPKNAIIGTASLRRSALINYHYPHLKTSVIRGNVDTRLNKLATQTYDGIILAAAGLKRLKLEHLITEYIDPNLLIPSAGQGAIGIQCTVKNEHIVKLLKKLNHIDTCEVIYLERAFLDEVDGTCETPVGAYAQIRNDMIEFSAVVAEPNGKAILQESLTIHRMDAELTIRQLGKKMHKWLVKQHIL